MFNVIFESAIIFMLVHLVAITQRRNQNNKKRYTRVATTDNQLFLELWTHILLDKNEKTTELRFCGPLLP